MPSIRVKTTRYRSLRDGAEAGRRRSHTTDDFSEASAEPVAEPGHSQDPDNPLHGTTEPKRRGCVLRDSASKVHSHILHDRMSTTALRNSRHRRSTLPPFTEGRATQQPYAQLQQENHDAEAAAVDVSPNPSTDGGDYEHHGDVVEHLEVIDPQMATISNLTHTANSVFFPPLPLDLRRPAVSLPTAPRSQDAESIHEDALDKHIEDVLSRKQLVKRTLQGVGSFVKTPLGFVFAIYAFNIVFWGAGIVFFLAKIINLHNAERQGYWVELTCQVETGLFTLTSVGLIPWRSLDTWRVLKIWHHKRKTIKLRRKAGVLQLTDLDDLPDPKFDDRFVKVLTNAEQEDLHYQQMQFSKSQTWYRPHGNSTHSAFPISTAVIICLLNMGNSIFQVALCGCMWYFNRFSRPPATTGILLPAGFLCGIGSAVAIWRGSQRSKKVEIVEERLRTALANEKGGVTRHSHLASQPSNG